ncbi:MAG: hypothetical protein AAFN41_05745, partial [Planctomycetota bacterium]
YVALNAEDFRATPAELACAAERGRVVLRNYTARSDRSRSVSIETETSQGTGFVRKQRTYGPWTNSVIWRATPVVLRITDAETHAKRKAQQAERQETQSADAGDDATDPISITHTLHLTDGRIMQGRLIAEAETGEVDFVVVVGSIEQPMRFDRDEVERIEPVR